MIEKLLIYLLEGCMYTQEMLNLLKNIDCYYHIKFVNQNDKGSVKLSNNMYSFPQVFYVVNNIKHKIGGYDEFKLLSEFKYYKKSYANDIKLLQRSLDIDKKILLRSLIYINKKLPG